MDNLYLILDESGNLHKNSKDRYFIIGGYLTNNALKARQLFKKELSTYKINNNLDNMVEIKGSMIKNYDKRNMLLSISNKMSKNNFETNLEKLDEIITELESGELSLDDAIKQYETAMKLIKDSSKILNEAEGKLLKVIEKNGDIDIEEI